MWAQTSQEVVWSDQWGEISFRTAIGDGTTNTRDLCSGIARLEAVFLEEAEYVVQAGTAVYSGCEPTTEAKALGCN
ncbi:MAG TPA: hypothetical protein VFT17_03155 [Propionibacteriaceae bacterium]|nr:hypothetical protein [Propionibacteriaceae bacterium]